MSMLSRYGLAWSWPPCPGDDDDGHDSRTGAADAAPSPFDQLPSSTTQQQQLQQQQDSYAYTFHKQTWPQQRERPSPPAPPPLHQVSFSDAGSAEHLSPLSSLPPPAPFPPFSSDPSGPYAVRRGSYLSPMLPEIVPLPPPSPQSAQSVVDSSDVERLADDLCRQHLEGQAMTDPDPTTAVDYDADSSWQHSVDLDLEVDDGISISSAAATPSLPPYRLRSMSSFASVPSQTPRAAVAAASTLPRSRQPARHHSYHHPPLPQTWIETTTCPQQEELQLQLQLQQQQQPRQLPPLLLPLSAASLALPQLAPTHRDVPSSGYDLCSWLDKTVGRGHVTGITLPTALSTMSTMPAELVPKTDGLEIDPDVDASSDADNSRDAAMCTEVAREIRMARLVRAAVTGQASGSKANPGPSPIPHDMASIAEDPDDDFLPMSLRMAGQPGGIRKVSFGLLHVRLSAAEIARRCPNLVYSRPRMRRRRPPGSGGAGGSSGGHRSFKAASRSPQPSAGSMAGEPDCEPPLALSTTLPSPALDLAADSMAVDFVEAAEP